MGSGEWGGLWRVGWVVESRVGSGEWVENGVGSGE